MVPVKAPKVASGPMPQHLSIFMEYVDLKMSLIVMRRTESQTELEYRSSEDNEVVEKSSGDDILGAPKLTFLEFPFHAKDF